MGIDSDRPILAVDPGEVRIGLAVSDPTCTIARPLLVLHHKAREKDAAAIVDQAEKVRAKLILVGLALDSEGLIGHQARRSLRLVEAIRTSTELPVETWDESGSTRKAVRPGKKKDPNLDARAAAYILQEYLDAKRTK